MEFILFFVSSAIFAFSPFSENGSGTLTVRFEGIEAGGGTVRLAMYSNRSEFMAEEKAVLFNFKVDKKGELEGVIQNLPAGSHAFAVFLDENNNMKLDKNLVGIPTEPYGFSRPPLSKWRLPTWDEVKFDLGQTNKVLVVRLKRWALL